MERKHQGRRIAKDNRMMLTPCFGSPDPGHLGEIWRSITARGKRCTLVSIAGSSAGIWDEILKHITTKIHAIVNALGNPLRFELTAGNSHDCVKGYDMLQNMDLTGKTVIADRGFDMNNILELIKEQQAIAVIPSRKHRKIQRKCDWWLYKERHLVECLFNKLKHYRRLATHYDKLTCTFAPFYHWPLFCNG
ncbi:IS5 family transposase [Paenibacillus solanacearum]|uniref:IS5 family transposase n=1 Tax=Paenibacillus solanacearum TaxID=2048548 RepID=UPI001FE740CB|nr:IS5 family transposase [Paenibacillus solanacearum]